MFNNKRITALEKRFKALEELLGIVLNDSDEYPEFNLRASEFSGKAYGLLGDLVELRNANKNKKKN